MAGGLAVLTVSALAVALDDSEEAPAAAAEVAAVVPAAVTPAAVTPDASEEESEGAAVEAAAAVTLEGPPELPAHCPSFFHTAGPPEPLVACGAGTAEVEDVAGASELVPDEAVAEDVVAEEAAAVEPVLLVVPGSVRQGETALVRLSGVEAASAFVTVAGFTVPMVAEGGAWLGYLPIPPLSPLGSSTVVVDLFDGAGAYQDTSLGQLTVVDAGAVVEEITLDPETAGLLAPELVAIDVDVRFRQHRAVSGPRRWRGAWRWPVVGESSSDFGVLRSYNGAPPRDWHHGHDITAEKGAVIVAAAAGVVVFADALPVHGRGVIVDHGAGVYSGYWHMAAPAVEAGQEVAGGEPLGSVGASGLALGPHLHWEVIVHGRDVDPLQWLEATLHQ